MKHFGLGSIIVIVITFILFVMALFTTGFTHDLLLEAGVFLVSVKLIIMVYNASVTSKDIHRELEEIKKNSEYQQRKHITRFLELTGITAGQFLAMSLASSSKTTLAYE